MRPRGARGKCLPRDRIDRVPSHGGRGSGEEQEHVMALQDLTDEAFLALAEPMMDNCLAGSNVLSA